MSDFRTVQEYMQYQEETAIPKLRWLQVNELAIKYPNDQDLGDCVKALLNKEAEELSHYELNGLAQILEYANDILDMEDYINDILEDNE